MILEKAHKFSAYALSGLLLILVLMSAVLVLKAFQIRDQTGTDMTTLQKDILFRSTDLFKPMRAVHLISIADPGDMSFQEFRDMVLELHDRAMSHEYFVIPLNSIVESKVFNHGDPLFLKDEYAQLYTDYYQAIAILDASAELLMIASSREFFFREFDVYRKHMEKLADSFNSLNNYYSKFQSYYFSDIRTTLDNNIKNLNNYLTFLPFLSSLLLVSMFFFLSFQRRSSKSLIQSEEKLRLLLDSTAEGIYGLDTNGNCSFINPACLSLLGYSEEEDLHGTNMHELIHHTDADGVTTPVEESEIYRTFHDGVETHYPRILLHRADKSSFFAEMWAHPIRRNEQIIGAVVTFFDITERIQAEEALTRSNQLAAAGQLASGIAHEINNPLATITACVEVLGSEGIKTMGTWSGSEKVADYLNLIREETERAAGIIRDLLDLTRQRPHHMTKFNLCEVVSSTIKLFQVQSRYSAYTFHGSFTLDVPDINGDRDRIRQVVVILLSNAIESMPMGGGVSVSLNVDLQNAQILLEISDEGVGIPVELQAKIFHPFFTTKLEEKGTGLGLSIAHSIITKHGGWISVKSTPGKGSTFTVKFPAVGGITKSQDTETR